MLFKTRLISYFVISKQQKTMDSLLIPLLAFIAGLAVGAYIVYVKRSDGTVAPVDCPKFDYSHEPDYKHLTSDTAHVLATNYKNWLESLSPLVPEDFQDARAVNFKLSDLKKFIWEMETRMCPARNRKELGIRFYYGKYPEGDIKQYPDLKELSVDYLGKHTLFLVPTYNDNGIFKDFDPGALGADGEPMINDDFTTMFIMNHGNIYPPPFEVTDLAPSYNESGILF